MWASAQHIPTFHTRDPTQMCVRPVRPEVYVYFFFFVLVSGFFFVLVSGWVARFLATCLVSTATHNYQYCVPLGPRRIANLPGWCWAKIQQFAPVGSSSSLHSEACNALGASDGVIHSSIS